jgi:RNA-binding protein
MRKLKGSERKYLKGLAHHLTPIVFIGKKGLTQTVVDEITQALDAHELIKLKFIDFKDEKKEFSTKIENSTKCSLVGMIGNITIFFREQADPAKRKIVLPKN